MEEEWIKTREFSYVEPITFLVNCPGGFCLFVDDVDGDDEDDDGGAAGRLSSPFERRLIIIGQ